MAVQVKIIGLQKVNKKLNQTIKTIQNKTDSAMNKAGFYMVGEVKQSIAGNRAEPQSVDTGRFLNSVSLKRPNRLTAVIESNVKYAKYLEFGTSRIKARKHFNNSLNNNRKKIKDFLQKALPRII